jgi:hypothetical protein
VKEETMECEYETVATLDLKVIFKLMIDGHLDPKIGLTLIANAYDVDPERFMFTIYGSQKRQSRHWTREEDEKLIASWNNGERAVNIANMLERSHQTIYQRIRHLAKLGHPVELRRKTENYKQRT